MHGLACVSYQGDQVVSGVAINIIAAGLTAVLGIAWFGQGGQTPPVATEVRIQALFPQFSEGLAGIPWVGALLGQGILGHNALVLSCDCVRAAVLVAHVQDTLRAAPAGRG